MIDQLTEEQQFLLLGKATGSLSPEEAIALENLFRENAEARQAYEELVRGLPEEDLEAYFAHRREHAGWKEFPAEFLSNRNIPQIHRVHFLPLLKGVRGIPWFRYAAAIILVVGSAAVWWKISRSTRNDGAGGITVATVAKKPGIQLRLANGKTIDLSAEKGKIDAGAAQLNNTDQSLSYSVDAKAYVGGTNSLTVPTGMDYKINLADGTEVWLNAATKLDFPLSFTDSKTREITINGEAYLKIAKNTTQPFIVHLPNSSVQVLGTEFNVNTYDSGVVKVALVEGGVKVMSDVGHKRNQTSSHPISDIVLHPGKQAIYTTGQSIVQETFDAKYVLSWRKGLFYFNDASLTEVSKVIPRWFGIQMVIDDPSINSRRFSGVINRNRPIAVFLEDLKAISNINSRFDKEGVLHLK